jgi:hypothetical protein
MGRLRQFIRSRSKGGLLAVTVAYSVAIQALMASVGFAMSIGVAPNRADLIFCSFASDQTTNAPAQNGGRQKPSPAPQCPFCFVAAQSAGHVANVDEAAVFPANAGLQSAPILDLVGAAPFVSQFRYRDGESRAPPAFSV